MPDALVPAELGFAEFTAQLVAELFEAVLASGADQDARRDELLRLAALTDAESEALVTDADVDGALARLFPLAGAAHGALAGAAYRPAKGGRPEEPPFLASLGVTIGASDFEPNTSNLSKVGAVRVRAAVRSRLAGDAVDRARAVVRDGLPRLVIDSGRINTSFAWRLEPAAPVPVGPRPGLRRPLPGLADLRLLVRPPAAATARDTATLTGSVEIVFRLTS